MVNSRYCICSNCVHPNYSSLATKGCDSVLIEDKYDVFYLLVMTSNDLCVGICLFGRGGGDYICPNFLRLHVSLGIHGVACVVLQRALHRWRYSSLPRVFLHSASFQFHSFLCGTISLEEELLYLPRLSGSLTWIAPDTPVRKSCSMQWQGMRHVQRFGHYCFNKGYMCGDMVAGYHCATLKLRDSPGWVPRSLQQLID